VSRGRRGESPAVVGLGFLDRSRLELLEGGVAVYRTGICGREGPAALAIRRTSVRGVWRWLSSACAGRSVGAVRLRTGGNGVCFVTMGVSQL
jgi:hypothetical protein